MRRTTTANSLILVLVLSVFLGCASYTQRMQKGLKAYEAGRMEEASAAFECAGGADRDSHLARLEKGMACLALGEIQPAIIDFTAAIDRMDSLTTGNAVRAAASYVLDDTVSDYVGAPYEQICSRLFQGIAYLMTPDPFENVSAAFRGMDIKMEQIEAYYERSYQFDEEGAAAEFSFQIPPAAKYFAALAAEQRGELDSADIYMRQALESMPGNAFLKRESQRMQNGVRENVVFVFTLLGMVPHKIEVESAELTAVLKGAKALYAIAKPEHNPNAVDRVLFTAPVMIPAYPKRQPFWHGGFTVRAEGGEQAETGLLADFDRYAREEFKVLMPGILIRAAVRRAVKEAAGQALGRSMTKEKEASKLLGDLFSSLAAVAETVDTRSWCTLPREIQAALLQVPEGTRSIVLTPRAPNGGRLGPDVTVPLDMSAKEPAFVIVVHPGRGARPIVLVDAAHRIPAAP